MGSNHEQKKEVNNLVTYSLLGGGVTCKHIMYFLLGMVSFNHFPFPPSTFCAVCKFMCTFEDPALIA